MRRPSSILGITVWEINDKSEIISATNFHLHLSLLASPNYCCTGILLRTISTVTSNNIEITRFNSHAGNMDDMSTKREYLDRKLERVRNLWAQALGHLFTFISWLRVMAAVFQETTNLDRLNDALKRSKEQTDSMLKVLDKFQERRQKLENTILPVYTQTKTYQRRQDSKSEQYLIISLLNHL